MENMVVNPDFWKAKNVLITGHTGFKGCWLSLWLQELGANVTGFSLPAPTQPNMYERAEVSTGMHDVTGDVRDHSAVVEALDDANPDVIFHMAAQSLVRPSYEDPLETYSTNVMGTANVLHGVRQLKQRPGARIRAVLVVTSDKCYENKEWDRGYKETDRLGGHDPYSNSKGCAELVTQAFRQSYFNDAGGNIGVATVRAGNVIGGGDWAVDRLVPDAVRAFGMGATLNIRNPNAVRPWQHVLEPLAGYLKLGENLYRDSQKFAESWNFGPDEKSEQPVSEIIRGLVGEWGGVAAWDVEDGAHPHEATFLKLDSSKARSQLGWKPRLDLPQTLRQTVSWYKKEMELSSMRGYSLNQIRDYQESAASS